MINVAPFKVVNRSSGFQHFWKASAQALWNSRGCFLHFNIPLLRNYPVMASCSESLQPDIFILNVVSNLEQSNAENSRRAPVWKISHWKQAQWIEPVVRSDGMRCVQQVPVQQTGNIRKARSGHHPNRIFPLHSAVFLPRPYWKE